MKKQMKLFVLSVVALAAVLMTCVAMMIPAGAATADTAEKVTFADAVANATPVVLIVLACVSVAASIAFFVVGAVRSPKYRKGAVAGAVIVSTVALAFPVGAATASAIEKVTFADKVAAVAPVLMIVVACLCAAAAVAFFIMAAVLPTKAKRVVKKPVAPKAKAEPAELTDAQKDALEAERRRAERKAAAAAATAEPAFEEITAEAAPAEETVEEAPVAEEAPAEEIVEETPVVEEAPAEEIVEEAPVVEEAPAEETVEAAPVVEEAPTEEIVEEAPVVEEAPAEEIVAEAPVVEETPVVEAAPVAETADDKQALFDSFAAIAPKSFTERFEKLDEQTKAFYEQLKAELLSYKKVKCRLSQKGESFRAGRKLLAKVAISGKTVKCYFALDPKAYDVKTYRHGDASEKRAYAEVPMLVRLRSKLSVKRATKLIEEMAAANALVKK